MGLKQREDGKFDTGRPPKYSSETELQDKIDEYFETQCKTIPITDENGHPLMTNKGFPVVELNPPTIAGLSLYLGFASRQSMYDYLKRNDDFSYIIKKAITKNIAYLIVSLFLITTTIFLMLNFVLPFFYNTKQDNQEDVIEITCEIECEYELVERGYIYPTLTATLKANAIPSKVELVVDGKSYDVPLDDFAITETKTDYTLDVEKVV